MDITVSVSEAPQYTLREAVGSGQCEGYEFDYCSIIPDHSFYIELDSKAYVVAASDVIQAVIAAHIEAKRETI